jgi:multiple sugar transport system ATP-binding protein
MATVTFKEASRIYPKTTRRAVDRLNLEIGDGEFVVLVGPSGCGKTTSLRMLAGLEPVDEGGIFIGEQNVVNLPPRSRDIAMVFQNYALYPHMNVGENMGFALKMAKLEKSEIASRVREAAKILDLEEFLDRKPGQLSGGQRQRVAMGRAIVRKPQVFLMDEPLSNLDAKLRVSTRTQIAELQSRLGVTTLYVTHDQVEAMTMGDRVAVLKDGVLQQVDVPRALYDAPVNSFVAGFIGSPAMNLLDAMIVENGVQIGRTVVSLPRTFAQAVGKGPVTVGLRPEAFDIAGEGDGIQVVVKLVEELGAEAYIYGQMTDQVGAEMSVSPEIVVRVAATVVVKSGDRITLHVKDDSMLLFDAESGLRIKGQ